MGKVSSKLPPRGWFANLSSIFNWSYLKLPNQGHKFSKASRERLDTCDPRLIEIMEQVLHEVDIVIVQGHRTQEEQDKFYRQGKSKLKYPRSKHNSLPSKAVDIAPYDHVKKTIDWNDRDSFHFLAGYVMAVAASKGIKLRWGGDWDRNFMPNKRTRERPFDDLVHFEILDD